MYSLNRNDILKGTKIMALVKFETNSELDMELKSIQLSRPDCNTNAAAAKHAINNYLSTCEELRELAADYDDLKQELEQIKHFYAEKLAADNQLQALLKP